MMLDKIDELLKEISNLTAKNAEDIERLRLKYLSKKGEITGLWRNSETLRPTRKKQSE